MIMVHKLLCLMIFAMIFAVYGDIFSMDLGNSYTELLKRYVVDPSTTVKEIKYLLNKGADIECVCLIEYESGNRKLVNLHKFGFEEIGRSPVAGVLPKNIYAGSKEVVDYIFYRLLKKKLKTCAKFERLHPECHNWPIAADDKTPIVLERELKLHYLSNFLQDNFYKSLIIC